VPDAAVRIYGGKRSKRGRKIQEAAGGLRQDRGGGSQLADCSTWNIEAQLGWRRTGEFQHESESDCD
jgi:hypothetical protein